MFVGLPARGSIRLGSFHTRAQTEILVRLGIRSEFELAIARLVLIRSACVYGLASFTEARLVLEPTSSSQISIELELEDSGSSPLKPKLAELKHPKLRSARLQPSCWILLTHLDHQCLASILLALLFK